jgi:hypothetical protein
VKLRSAPALLLLLLVFSSCFANANLAHGTPDAQGAIAGFWLGLWHGMVAPLSFLVSLFSEKVGVYEVHNSGHWYDLGFLLGLASAYGGSHAGDRVRRRMLVSVEVKKAP